MKKVKIEIEVFPDVARYLRNSLSELHAYSYGTDAKKVATKALLCCGMATALVDDVCRALPPEPTDA